MSVRLVMLKSGEDLISIVREMVIQEKVVGYYLEKPCVIEIQDARKYNEKTGKTAIDITLIPWLPLSKTELIPIPADWVITIVDPIDKLLEMYKVEVLKDDQVNSSSEQSDTDIQN